MENDSLKLEYEHEHTSPLPFPSAAVIPMHLTTLKPELRAALLGVGKLSAGAEDALLGFQDPVEQGSGGGGVGTSANKDSTPVGD